MGFWILPCQILTSCGIFRDLVKADIAVADLRWGQRFCISEQLPEMPLLLVNKSHFPEQLCKQKHLGLLPGSGEDLSIVSGKFQLMQKDHRLPLPKTCLFPG